MRMPTLLFIVMCAGLSWTSVQLDAAEYFVSPAGDDNNSGSADSPLRTIQAAAGLLQPGEICTIQEGRYRETVRPPESGTAEAPIVFRAATGETVVITGTEPVDDWQRVDGDLWRAPIGFFDQAAGLGRNNQVFSRGRMVEEARWPNVQDDDLMTPEGAEVTSGGMDFVTCDALPDRPEGYWNGCTLWCLGGANWTSWTRPVVAYDPTSKKISYGGKSAIPAQMNPGTRDNNHFYLVGRREEIDSANEWFYDADERMLYYQVPTGTTPDDLAIEMKCRKLGIDIYRKEQIRIEGINLYGCTVRVVGSSHCEIVDMTASYISHTRGGDTSYSLNESTGIVIDGDHNTIRDSEVVYSVGDGVLLTGSRGAVINCLIHNIDYSGSYGTPVKTLGREMLISHNTIRDAGRDCVQPAGQANIIEYNDIYNMGLIASDLGATYVCGQDGGGTEFRYNWAHDNQSDHCQMGIYLDNFTSNYFVHHNVCWNTKFDGIRLNKPSSYNVVANNTVIGYMDNWGRWPSDWMYGCAYVNNLVRDHVTEHPQTVEVANTPEIGGEQLALDNFMTQTIGRDQGVKVPGITDGFQGSAPDQGAYEYGLSAWRPGHDFDNPPSQEYRLTETPLRNLVRHGSFDWSEYSGAFGPWEKFGDGTARIIRGEGGISSSYTERDTIINYGVCLEGDQGVGIEQDVVVKQYMTYDLAAWVKLEGPGLVRLGVRSLGSSSSSQKEYVFDTKKTGVWTHVHLRFQHDDVRAVRVYILKLGSDRAFVDDVGLVPVLDNLPIGKPGFANEAEE